MIKAPESTYARKEVIAALNEGEAKYRVFVEMAPLAVCIFQWTRFKHVKSSTEQRSLSGYKQPQEIG